jgi:rep protein
LKGGLLLDFERLENPISINDDSIVRLKEMGNVIEVMYSEHRNNTCYIQKLDKENYVDLRTGELKQYEYNKNRAQNMQHLKRSLNNGRDMINANCTEIANCRFITVTYRQRDNYDEEPKPMTDTKRLYNDLKNFREKIQDVYGIKNVRILTFCEPQGNRSWHAHIIVVFNQKAPYMPNDVVADWWGQGFVRVERIKDEVDNIGAYLTAYLCDVDVDEFKKEFPNTDIDKIAEIKEVDIETENGQTIKKRYVKGARLHYYPPYFNPFRCTRNCVKPTVSNVSYKMAKEKASAGTLTFTKTVQLKDTKKDFENTIQTEYYNTKRK